MKKFTLVLACFFLVKLLSAQTDFEYSYDNNGNRISRQEITLKTMENGDNGEEDGVVYFSGETIVKVFPNPTKGYVQIASNEELEPSPVVVYDLNGRVVLQKEMSGTNSDVDLSAEPAGKYLMIIGTGHERKEFVIIKE